MSDPGELSREELLAALAERDAVIAALLAEIEQLKRRVGMDSSNSSMPPGSDGLAARARRARKPRKRSPRPRGGQPGHEGHASPREPSRTRPQAACPRSVKLLAGGQPHGEEGTTICTLEPSLTGPADDLRDRFHVHCRSGGRNA